LLVFCNYQNLIQSKNANPVRLVIIPSSVMVMRVRMEKQHLFAYLILVKVIACDEMVSIRLIDNASSLSLLFLSRVLALI
jgi:hypothetical protein